MYLLPLYRWLLSFYSLAVLLFGVYRWVKYFTPDAEGVSGLQDDEGLIPIVILRAFAMRVQYSIQVLMGCIITQDSTSDRTKIYKAAVMGILIFVVVFST